MIAWRKAKIFQFNRRIQRGQHGTGSSKQVCLKPLWGLTCSDLFGPLILKTTYHTSDTYHAMIRPSTCLQPHDKFQVAELACGSGTRAGTGGAKHRVCIEGGPSFDCGPGPIRAGSALVEKLELGCAIFFGCILESASKVSLRRSYQSGRNEKASRTHHREAFSLPRHCMTRTGHTRSITLTVAA